MRYAAIVGMMAALAGCEQGPQPFCVPSPSYPDEEDARCEGATACCTLHGASWVGGYPHDCAPIVCIDGAPTCVAPDYLAPYPEGTHPTCLGPPPASTP